MNKLTNDLRKLVERRAGEQNSFLVAQQLIDAGADITVQTKDGPMIHAVINEERRLRPVLLWKADNCVRLIEVLQRQASRLLAARVLSSNSNDINEIRRFIELQANSYQSDTFGALGLLGDLLKEERISIQLAVIQILIASDPYTYAGLTAENDAKETCLTIARSNRKCSKEVIDYLQLEFDKILNKIPFSRSPINIKEVTNWIRRGANTEMTDEKGNTVLLNAVLTNNLELVRTLVSCGSNIFHKNAERLTALDIAEKTTPRNQLLIAALQAQSVNMELRKLIETKKSQLTVTEVSTLLSKGANINASITNHGSLLHLLIVDKGSPEMITAFINEFDADITLMNTKGYRAIETCILIDEKPFELLKIFLKLSKVTTSMFFNSKLNQTLLQFAAEHKRTDAVDLIQQTLNERLWICVIENGIKNMLNENVMIEIKQLINYGAQINYKHTDKNYQEWTILHLACQKTNQTFVQFLIEQMKADHLLPNGSGNYPIAITAEHGNLSILQYLWKLPKSNLNVTNKDNETPLHLATKNRHLLIVRFLIRWGADPKAQDFKKRTALDIAKMDVSNNKLDGLNAKKLLNFLEQLICPSIENSKNKSEIASKKPNIDQDTCELVMTIPIKPIQIGDTDPLKRGIKSLGLLAGTPNDNLHDAVRKGLALEANQAIGQDADICYRKNGFTPYEVALQTARECYTKLQSPHVTLNDRQKLQEKMQWCQQIANTISQIALTKMIKAIEQSNTGHVVAYHIAGAPLTNELLYCACSSSDNVEIVHYLVQQSKEIFQSVYRYNRPESPYKTAKRNKFNRVASYLKYISSIECTKAIKENNLPDVKQLVLSGASVDMTDTNNLQIALKHENIKLIEFLCVHGAKMPKEWLENPNIILPVDIAQTMSPDIIVCINRCLINRRLLFAAADGNLADVIRCQRLGANINSMNCYGSTAVLCAIQHGNYFSIIHALVSCGASILHYNDNEPMSLIDIAKSRQYDTIVNYLTKELNNQFIVSIINDDRKSAQKFEELGVDFNYQDEQKRTALHYAVQYHGIDLVTWLCDRRSIPMSADVNGDYPIMLATQKGDYPVVELFILRYPATRKQTNQSGSTALQIAEKLDYQRIKQLIETGKPVFSPDDNKQPQGPKYTSERLREAAQKGQVAIIREFREDRYDSRDEKRQLCYQLLKVAEKHKQFQIVDILKPYFDEYLKPDIPSDISIGEAVTLNKPNKKILLGFLTGLGNVVTECPVLLDPSDPNTYQQLFSGLGSKLMKRLKQLKKVKNGQDAKDVYQQDSANMGEKLNKIKNELQVLVETRKETILRIQEHDEQLSKQKDLSALQRKALFEEKESYEQQLVAYECSITLYQREEESILNRQKNLQFIQNDTNLYLFYCTIENRLESLFHGVFAAQSGGLQAKMQTKNPTTTQSSKMVSSLALLTFCDVIVSAVKETLADILSKLNQTEQKQEWYNISTIGTVGEIKRLASDTAGFMTLYYKEQIQSIDTSCKITGTSPYNDQFQWIKDVFINIPGETAEEIPVIVVADYVTAWIIHALKVDRKEIKLDKPLPQQLWYLVAKKNIIEQRSSNEAFEIVSVKAGQQQIPLKKKKKNMNNEESPVYVQLRYLIGCVSVVGLTGEIYQYSVSLERSTEQNFDDLDIFGYVYASVFSSDENILQSIVTGRGMQLAMRNDQNDIITKLDEMKQLAKLFNFEEMERANQSCVSKDTINQVAQVLREQKTFANVSDVKAELNKVRKVIGFTVDTLKEDIQKKVEFYQTSINAAHEQIQQESTKNRKTMEHDNEERYNQAINKLSHQLKEMKMNLEEVINQRMNIIETEMRNKTEEILAISKAAKDHSDSALIQATQAARASEKSEKSSEENTKHSQQLVQSTEQRRQELQLFINQCEQKAQTTNTELKNSFEQNVLGIRTRFEKELDDNKRVTTELATNAKESSKAAQDAMSSARDLTKITKEELQIQKTESKKILSDAHEARRQSERSADFSKETEKQARRAVDTNTAELKKLTEMFKKMQETIQRLEKLEKKAES
ncbi:unnamed protein product [Adineta steineri]|uniref:Ankyrin repeat protein n=1 Tax=Adineta steineri TaxID=433720 RepID=A0A815GUA7_9BILA|nr:unnamed protein product [Adineta steineri]CAF3868955.1 unnamed protein product [Adineta steineri]